MPHPILKTGNSSQRMHEHTTELVTNLLLPSWFDLQSTVASTSKLKNRRRRRGSKGSSRDETVAQPLNSIDIIDGDDYYEIEHVANRLRSSIREPHVEQIVLSEIQLEPAVVQAFADLLSSRNADDGWEAVFLEFCGGRLEDAIRTVLNLNNVKKLEIAAGMSQRTALRALAAGQEINDTLQELSLFSAIDEEVVGWLTQCFTHNTRLSTLRFTKCTLTESSTDPLAAFLKSIEHIEILRIDRCILDGMDRALGTILESIVGHPTLKELSIGGSLGEDSQAALSTLLTHNRLTKLCLQNRNAFAASGVNAYRNDIQWMAAPLAANTSLMVLDLSQRCLDDESLSVLSEALCNGSSRLEELRLHENHISNNGIEIFALSIRSLTSSLKRIFLHRNRFDEAGAEALLKALRQSYSIRELTIPCMGRSSLMTKYQRLINYETMLICGGKHLLKDTVVNSNEKKLPASLWPLVFERAGRLHWTPYCEYQMTGAAKWKSTQQADLLFYLLRGSTGSIQSSEIIHL
jgi:hypothetical protein